MKLSAEIIHERMFDDLRQQLKDFHKKREDSYVSDLQDNLHEGIESPHDTKLVKKLVAKYAEDTPFCTLQFVKKYVMETSDSLTDAFNEGILDKEEYEVAFSTLKYMLIAAEMDVDPETKITYKG